MDDLEQFIEEHMSFLWTDGRFEIEQRRGGAGSAAIYLRSPSVRMLLTRDRGQRYLDLMPNSPSVPSWHWYPASLVLTALGVKGAADAALLTPELADGVRRNLGRIEAAFSADEWDCTEARLEKLEGDWTAGLPGMGGASE